MDVDTTNQSAPPLATARPTATDPRLNRVSNTSQDSAQAHKAPYSSTPSLTPTTSRPEQQNASNSPSTGCPPGPNGVHPVKEQQNVLIPDIGNIAPLLTQLLDSRVAMGFQRQEKAEREKEDAVLRKTLSRARALPSSFPSLVDSVQSMRENPSTELQKLEADLTKQQAICSDMAEELQVLLRAALCASGNENAIKVEAKLKEEWKAERQGWKAELQVWKAKIKEEWEAEKEEWKAQYKEEWKAELKDEMAKGEKRLGANIRSNIETEIKEKLSSDLSERLRAEFKETQSASTSADAKPEHAVPSDYKETFDRLENSVNFVSMSNRNLGARISRVENWKKVVEEGRTRLPSQTEAPVESSKQANLDLEKLEEQIPALETRLSKVEQQHSEWSGLVQENTGTLHILKSAHEVAQEAEKSKIATLEAQIQQIQNNPAMSASSNLLEQVRKLLQQAPELRAASEELQNHRSAINTLSSRAESGLKTQETMAVALRSLEQRWNHINSEELVKSMANAIHEMYPGMQKLLEQYNSLHAQFNATKDEIMKEINSIKSSMNNEDKASIAIALQEFKQLSEQFAQLQETQKSQSKDIVRHLEEVKELRNQLDGYSLALVELGDKQADDVSDLSEEIKASMPRFREYDTRLKSQAKQCKDLEESAQRVRGQLDTLMESTSEDNIKRICEDAQREKFQVIAGRMEEFNSQGMSLLRRLKDIQTQGFGSSDMSPESTQSLTNELLSASGINGSSNPPQNANPRNFPDRPQLRAATQGNSNATTPMSAPQVPTGLRAIMPKPASSAPSTGAVGGSFRIKGVASQQDSERGQTGSSSQSSPRKNSCDTPMNSRVTTNPPSPTITIAQNRSATTGPDFPTPSSAPSNAGPSNPPPQASTGKKRPRQSPISDDESREERRANPVLSKTANSSPAPSSASDVPLLRKGKKAKKKEKQQKVN